MLHVTNGESAAQGLRDAGLTGDILCWKDVLHEGPVPAGVDDTTFAEVRSRFIAACEWAPYDMVRADFARRSARLARARDDDEIVLWFEHDLYDQLQLIEVLTRLTALSLRPRQVMQVASDRYLGTLPAEWFRTEFNYREPVTDGAWQEAERAWGAFVAPDPTDLDALRASVGELPFLPHALTRHLQELPSVHNGLSRFEQQLLHALADGPQDLLATFHAAHHDREEALYLGDIVFAWHVSRLSRGDGALIRRLDSRTVNLPRNPTPAYWEQRILLTSLAERILAGQVDRVASAGIDRWLGGVHLEGHEVDWRWDEDQSKVMGSG